MNFKAVIFDLDGTLLDTIDDLADSMNCVLESSGYPVHDVEKYKYFVGNGLRNLVRRALPENVKDDAAVDQYLCEMNSRYAEHWADKTRPYEGIPELLKSLDDMKIKMTVFSNKPHEFTVMIIKDYFGEYKFEAVFGERKDFPRKPDPYVALEICQMLGCRPEEVLYLGDTNTDMETASRAGMYPVGALWGFRKEDELIESGAKAVIKEPGELLGFFEASR